MIELIDRLRNLVFAWSTIPAAESASLVEQENGQTSRCSGPPPAPNNRDIYTPSEETVPDLKLLDDSPDPATRGFNPYETSSNFRWKPGGDRG